MHLAAVTATEDVHAGCTARADQAEASVRTLQTTIATLQANIRLHVVDAALQEILLHIPGPTLPVASRARRTDPDPDPSPVCRDYALTGGCSTCGGESGLQCVANSRCAYEVRETCISLLGRVQPPGFEYGWDDADPTTCLAAVICVDCCSDPSADLDLVPCPPSGYESNTSHVVLLLDNSLHLNLSGAFGTIDGVQSPYPRYLAALSLSNTTLTASHFSFGFMDGIGGTLNLSSATILGAIGNQAFYELSMYGTVDMRGANLAGGISDSAFQDATIYRDFDLSGANITAGISQNAFGGATFQGITVNLSGADISGGISTAAFESATFFGFMDLTGSNVSAGISREAFNDAAFNGNIDLSGADVSGGVWDHAFEGATLQSINFRDVNLLGGIHNFPFLNAKIHGAFSLEGADLSGGGIQAGSFLGATVAGLFSAAGARFPNNRLPIQMLFGLEAQYGLDFSFCNLERLEESACLGDSGCFSDVVNVGADGNDDDVAGAAFAGLQGGPFTGMSMTVGITSVAVNLSHNHLTEIKNTSLLGITATMLDLSHNPDLAVYHPFWFVGVPNAKVIVTTGNPSTCHRVNDSDSGYTFQVSGSIACTCGAGTRGTGNFCANASCGRTLATLNAYAADTLGGAVFVGDRGVLSGHTVTMVCPHGKHTNRGSTIRAQCLGGAFLPQTNQCVNDAAGGLSAGEIAGIVVGSVVAAAVVGFFLLLSPEQRKRRRLAMELQTTAKQTELNELLLHETQGDLEEATAINTRMRGAWNIATSDVVVGAVLASGTFGVVHDGSFAGLRVAIKVLKYPLDEELYPDVGKDFARECETLMAIRHASLLIFYGAGLTVENKPFMVTEFMSRGSLKTMLLDHQQPFEWTVRAKCALQIARAMEYLHSIEIVHRDLKSDNCLVNGTMDTKVCDFGTSKFLTSSRRHLQETAFDGQGVGLQTEAFTATMTRGVGTILWMAPELFVSGTKYGPEVDMYSYGVILWELATRAQPWGQIRQTEYIKFYAALCAALEAGKRPEIPADVANFHHEFVQLMQRCWTTLPAARPTFEEVATLLQS